MPAPAFAKSGCFGEDLGNTACTGFCSRKVLDMDHKLVAMSVLLSNVSVFSRYIPVGPGEYNPLLPDAGASGGHFVKSGRFGEDLGNPELGPGKYFDKDGNVVASQHDIDMMSSHGVRLRVNVLLLFLLSFSRVQYLRSHGSPSHCCMLATLSFSFLFGHNVL